MAILERTDKQKLVINSIVIAMMLAVILLAALLIKQASQMSSLSTASSASLKIGPLTLMQLQKIPVAKGGFEASIKFLPGIIVYIIFWLIVAGLLIIIRKKSK